MTRFGHCQVHHATIAQGVDRDLISRKTNQAPNLGAGDQGMVFGYATDETEEGIPLSLAFAHRLALRLTEVRESGQLPYLRPDGKTQVSVVYENGKPVGIDTILISAQHEENIEQARIKADLLDTVVRPTLPDPWFSAKTRFLVNPTGRFVVGGPVGDSGLTGRKIIVDTYGGAARHGGGAFSGKDPTKVDRNGAYAARYAAKNIVAAGLAHRVEIQIAYAIGIAEPVSVLIDTFGTGLAPDESIQAAVRKVIDFRPASIIRELHLQRPIYRSTAAYGHFGRQDVEFPWEKTDHVYSLQEALFAKSTAGYSSTES